MSGQTADPFTMVLQRATSAQIQKTAGASALIYARLKLVSSLRGGLEALLSGHTDVTLRGERSELAALLQILEQECAVSPVIRAKVIRAMETGEAASSITLCAAEIQAIVEALVCVAIFDVEILFTASLKAGDKNAFRSTRELWFVGESSASAEGNA